MYSSPGFMSGTCFCVVRYIPRAEGMRYCDWSGAWAGGGTCQSVTVREIRAAATASGTPTCTCGWA
jgi:hypothetical protein